MQNRFKRSVAALLASLMILPTVSCAKEGDLDETKAVSSATAVTEAETGDKPDIEVQDYDCEFVMMGVEGMAEWAVADEDTAGDPFMDRIYERGVRIGEHLGVELVMIPGGAGQTYLRKRVTIANKSLDRLFNPRVRG